MPIADHPRMVQAIHEAVTSARAHSTRQEQGWYDGHHIVNYLNQQHNDVLNEIIDMYAGTLDPVHQATIQIGNFLRLHLRQNNERYPARESRRRITLRNGKKRNGVCAVSCWEISPETEPPAPNTIRAEHPPFDD